MSRSLTITLALGAFALAATLAPGVLSGQAPAAAGQAPAAAPAAPARGVQLVGMTPAQRAHADIAGQGIKGTADFEEFSVSSGVLTRITVSVQGLPPGIHGMHIHAVGKCDGPDFLTAGGHFDPGPYGHADTDVNHPYHSGDLPNISSSLAATGTNASTTVYSTRISLGGPLSIGNPPDGTAIVINGGPDSFAIGRPGQVVDGGRRLACGVIRRTF